MYQLVIDGDFELMLRMELVFSGLTMSMVRKNFNENIGESMKKLTGGNKHEELSNKYPSSLFQLLLSTTCFNILIYKNFLFFLVAWGGCGVVGYSYRMFSQASDNMKLTPGFLIEVSRLPGYVLQTKGETTKTAV